MPAFQIMEVDAGKFLHAINVGAQSRIRIFEDRVRAIGKELGYNWQLASIDRNTLLIEDIDTHRYYHGTIENLGKGKIKIAGIKQLRIVESKRGGTFRENVKELVNAIAEDKEGEADIAFNKIARQRFRPNAIPENGMVTTRDGKVRCINTNVQMVEEKDKAAIIKAIAKEIGPGVKVVRGGIIEATYNEKPFTIPITEVARRKVVAAAIKEHATKAYLSSGFQRRTKDAAGHVVKHQLQEAANLMGSFFTENQEFSLLTEAEMKELASNALAACGCFNQQLSEDVGSVMYKTNCKVNKTVILNEWAKTARMTEFVPLVENVRKLRESTTFEEDYNSFLNAFFVEDARSTAVEAGEHLLMLRKIAEILTSSKQYPDELDKVHGYITSLEERKGQPDNALLNEVRQFLGTLAEEILSAAQALGDYASPTIGTFDNKAETTSQVQPKEFGQGGGGLGGGGPIDLGGVGAGEPGGLGELGGAGAPGASGGEEPGGVGELPGDEEGGGLEALLGGAPGGEEEEEGLLSADIQRKSKPISEAGLPEHLKKFQFKKKGGDEKKDEDKKDDEKKECPPGIVKEMHEAVRKLDTKGLSEELVAWRESAQKYFAEDGRAMAIAQLKAYIERANELKNEELASSFKTILVENTPISIAVEDDDPYPYKKISEEKLDAGGILCAAPKCGKAMGHQDCKDAPTLPGTDKNVPKGPAKKISNKTCTTVVCDECQESQDIVECLKVNGICSACGADLNKAIAEAVDVSMVKKDDGKGVADKKVGQVKITGGGDKPNNESPDGKGVAKSSLKKVDGTSAVGSGGKKDGMDQDGKPISGKVKGEVEESSLKGPTRKSLNFPSAPKSRNRMAAEEVEADDVVRAIAEAMDEEGDLTEPEGDLEAPPPAPAGAVPEASGTDEVESPVEGLDSEPSAGAPAKPGSELNAGEETIPPIGPDEPVPEGVASEELPEAGLSAPAGMAAGAAGLGATGVDDAAPGPDVMTVEAPAGTQKVVVKIQPEGGEIPSATPEIGPEVAPETEPGIPGEIGGEVGGEMGGEIVPETEMGGTEEVPPGIGEIGEGEAEEAEEEAEEAEGEAEEAEEEAESAEKKAKRAKEAFEEERKFKKASAKIGSAGEDSIASPPNNKKTEKAARLNPKPKMQQIKP